MKIIKIIEEGRIGGPQIDISLITPLLEQRRIMSTVILPEKDSFEFQKLLNNKGISFKTIRLTSLKNKINQLILYLLTFPFEIFQLTKLIKKLQPDIVHVCGGSWQIKGPIAGKLAGKKVFWHLNDTFMPWIVLKNFHLLSPLSDAYIYASERTKAYYLPYIRTGKYERVIPAPVDTNYFDPQKNYQGDEELIKKWEGKIVIGTIGNVNPVKGLETYINVAKNLNVEFKKLVFVVIGPIYESQKFYFEKLKLLCRTKSVNNLEFIGGRTDVRPLLKRFDIYVCSSNAESSPISVWEAMSMQKAIISTDVGDVSLYIKDGHNGFVVGVGDSIKLCCKLEELIQNDSKKEHFGIISRKIAINYLDVQKCAKLHINAYKYFSKN